MVGGLDPKEEWEAMGGGWGLMRDVVQGLSLPGSRWPRLPRESKEPRACRVLLDAAL